MTSRHFIALFLCAVLGPASTRAERPCPPVDAVDPFLGTLGDGNVYPGASLPFGFIQVSPDTVFNSRAGGYKYDKAITGFSQQHISGMGGPILGAISLLPLTGDAPQPSQAVATGKSAESATPGYYTVFLEPWQVKVELTASRTVAWHRETFPASDSARILVNVGHCLYGLTPSDPAMGSWSSAYPIGGAVQVDSTNREVSGFMVYEGGRSTTQPWKVYFAATFDTDFSSYGTWDDSSVITAWRTSTVGKEIGASLTFHTRTGQVVQSKVAVSWRSVDQARGYLAAEPGWDFEATREQARTVWAQTLDALAVEGGTEADHTRFYTALYRAHLTPNNWTNESPERYGSRTYYENLLCMWDTFRTVNPLFTLIQPQVQADIVNSIINFHQVDGWTGDAHSAHQYEHVQNGSHADSIIADAYVKQLPGVDWDAAYAAIRKNAFEEADPAADKRPIVGRFRLTDYIKHHYLPTDTSSYSAVQSVSRTLEYVHNDFCVYTLAKDHGTPEDAQTLKERLTWYRNLWDPETNFMRGRTAAGTWHEPFDPLKEETGKQYYEGHAWTWSWYVPHDTNGLINLLGGTEAFVEKLTTTCENYYEAYNEPCMLETYLFVHAGRPDLTQRFAREALKNFTVAKDGLPGNDDSGTTSAWLVWTMLGIYPHATEDYYYIGSPTFPQVTINLGTGKTFVVKASNTTAENIYISSATLNGKPWHKAWLRHADIIKGGELELTMTDQPSNWGNQNPPPSFSLLDPAQP